MPPRSACAEAIRLSPDPVVPRLVHSLSRVSRRHRVARKLIVAPNYSAGRELLRRLSLQGNGWIGFEVTTPRRLAHRIAQPGLEASRLKVIDAFDQQALVDRALDAALAGEHGRLAELGDGVGFREKVHDAVVALRMAGIDSRALDDARFGQWEKKRLLFRVLRRYERYLAEGRRADPATVIERALIVLDAEGGRLPASLDIDVLSLMPGLHNRGLLGVLVSALAARGARLLETDPVQGLDAPKSMLWGRCGPPAPGTGLYAPEGTDGGGGEAAGDEDCTPLDVDFFCAASIEAELREVLRRVVSQRLPWDQVEIIASDASAYGSAMHALATRLRIPVTYAVGLPVARTRTGRVVQAYLDWVEEGFQADPIRRLLEAGDLRAPKSKGDHAAASLARRFRSLRIGWGRKRYRAQIREALQGIDHVEAGRREPPAIFDRRRERARGELEALKSILFPALSATPAVPDRMSEGGEPVTPAELARGLRAFLRRVPKGRGPDRSAREEVARVLERIEATLTRRTEFRSAVTVLRRHLDLRVRPDMATSDPESVGAPWSSEGGALHISDLEHGGYSGRPVVFLVGFDAERVPGGGGQDPVLLDGDRRVLGEALPTSDEVLKGNVFRVAALVARLRGQVTMSYGSWQATEARTVGPSSVLLQALRMTRRDATLTFQDLHETMHRVVSAVPTSGSAALDSDDVWMELLGSGDVMRRGEAAVRASFGALDRGLAASEERRSGLPGPIHGVISARPDELDPRRNPEMVLSASRLEALGACPLRYLHSTVLRLYPPDDPEMDPDAWLDARDRGKLLHDVFDTALRSAGTQSVRPEDAAFEELALEALESGVTTLRHSVPSPGEGTLSREIANLREDVRSFVRMIREHKPEYVALELKFGLGDDEPVVMEVPGGRLHLRGAVDRVDHDLAGLHVVDYKTGGVYGYGADAFNGGRRLQHAIYAHVAESRLGHDVVDGQYHFPTRRGQNQAVSYDRAQLSGIEGLLDLMLEGVALGHFVPTDDSNDCSYCDFAAVCRARRGSWGSVVSPLTEWSKEHANAGVQPAFVQLKKSRTYED